jgi:hypothetical protein
MIAANTIPYTSPSVTNLRMCFFSSCLALTPGLLALQFVGQCAGSIDVSHGF